MSMTPVIEHDWNLSEEEAVQLQIELAEKVEHQGVRREDVRTVLGLDVAYGKESELIVGAGVLLDFQTQEVLEEVYAVRPVEYPYVPGLFSFREMPSLIDAVSKLQHKPDLVVCDGHGLNHPRGFGLANHFGVLFDVPTIGCAKKPFWGDFDAPAPERGSYSDIMSEGRVLGRALRTQTKIKPVYVSIGHRCSLAEACSVILHLASEYRLPSTTRASDSRVNAFLKELRREHGLDS